MNTNEIIPSSDTTQAVSKSHWTVFDYEVDMLDAMCRLLESGNAEYSALNQNLRNAVVESALLHTRILTEVLLSRGNDEDDIQLRNLLPNFKSETIEELKIAYGDRKTPGSPCWTLNKMLAHPTAHRGNGYDYSILLTTLVPLIFAVTDVIGHARST